MPYQPYAAPTKYHVGQNGLKGLFKIDHVPSDHHASQEEEIVEPTRASESRLGRLQSITRERLRPASLALLGIAAAPPLTSPGRAGPAGDVAAIPGAGELDGAGGFVGAGLGLLAASRRAR